MAAPKTKSPVRKRLTGSNTHAARSASIRKGKPKKAVDSRSGKSNRSQGGAQGKTADHVDKKKVGHPEKYSKEFIAGLLDRMSEGLNLKEICDTTPDVNYLSIWQRIHADEELALLYTRGRDCYAHSRVAAIHRIATTEPDVARARLMCDNIKWEASKVLPKFYGDSTTLKHTDPSGNAPPRFIIDLSAKDE